jgi:hypothetical protein
MMTTQNQGNPPTPTAPKQLRMVGWYDPRQLAKTAVEVAVSTIFGRHSDHRLVEAMAAGENNQPEFFDYTVQSQPGDNGNNAPRTSIWIDYVGDVGDGWNSTYAIAYNLAQEKCDLVDPATGKKVETKRGDLLLFGGDEVYPTASREAYRERLLAPYETALRETKSPNPDAFAIPGNHDWYDSLVSFTRLFTSRRWFAGWRTRQSRSYFALKLPHNWWLLGTDVQLGSDIDGPQVDYFERVAKSIKAETAATGKPASLILCHAEPHWIRAWQYESVDPSYTESNLKLLEKRLGKDVAVFIAGDLHHYRRHEALDRSTQKITAGGGGAFLHPTHSGWGGTRFDEIYEKNDLNGAPVDRKKLSNDQIFKLKQSFPSEKDSSRACLRNLAFPFFLFMKNESWTLGVATALLYLLLAFPISLRVADPALLAMSYTPGTVLGLIIHTMTSNGIMALLILITLVGFVFFTDTHKVLYRVVGGLLHGAAHIFSAYYIALIAVSLLGNNLSDDWRMPIRWFRGFEFFLDLRMLLSWPLIFIGGFIAGTFIMGVYLVISLNVFGRHGNEAFSSLGIEDWKHFIRMHINDRGDLTIYPIGLRRVPRKWRPRTGISGPEFEPVPPDDPATKPELIEAPIVMQKATTTGTGVQCAPTPATSS